MIVTIDNYKYKSDIEIYTLSDTEITRISYNNLNIENNIPTINNFNFKEDIYRIEILEDKIDVSRGDMIVKPNNQPKISQDLDAFICWFSGAKKLTKGGKYIFRHTTKDAQAILSDIRYKVDVNSLRKMEAVENFQMNDIGRVSLRISQPVFYDTYQRNRNTGSFILVDPFTNETLAAGMLR